MFHKIDIKRIKLVFAFAFLTVLAAVLIGGPSARVHAQTAGPEGGTGAPGEETCAICHTSFALNSGGGNVSIMAPPSYQPGQTYQITVQSSAPDPTRKIWGFLLTVLTAGNEPAGSLQTTSMSTLLETGVGSFPNRQYMRFAQNFAGAAGGVTWLFNWTAPATGQGPVTFYSSFIQGNFDNTDAGDYIYTASSVVPLMGGPPPPPPPIPTILNAAVAGKNLDLMVQDCDSSSVIIVNGVDQRTIFDPDTPSLLVGKKTVKKMKIKVGKPVTVQVKNTDTGQMSADFTFTRTK